VPKPNAHAPARTAATRIALFRRGLRDMGPTFPVVSGTRTARSAARSRPGLPDLVSLSGRPTRVAHQGWSSVVRRRNDGSALAVPAPEGAAVRLGRTCFLSGT